MRRFWKTHSRIMLCIWSGQITDLIRKHSDQLDKTLYGLYKHFSINHVFTPKLLLVCLIFSNLLLRCLFWFCNSSIWFWHSRNWKTEENNLCTTTNIYITALWIPQQYNHKAFVYRTQVHFNTTSCFNKTGCWIEHLLSGWLKS